MNEIGPTNEFPDGKINDDDEGEINIAIGTKNNKLCMEFGTSIRWIGVPKTTALIMAETIIKHANTLN